ncbi:MAG: hypothetical protein M0Q49_10760 [Porticoccaceae bacterium]|nr:hypothetical protein [Porticoccaceae bacterium]
MVDKTRLLLFAVVIWAVPLSLCAAGLRLDAADRQERGGREGAMEEEAPGAVRQGCIASYLIRRVSFDNDRTGILELKGKQRIRLTLRNACSGIRFNGYVHKPVNRRFCEGDILRVMGSGGFCVVDSLTPLADDETLEAEEAAAGEH